MSKTPLSYMTHALTLQTHIHTPSIYITLYISTMAQTRPCSYVKSSSIV